MSKLPALLTIDCNCPYPRWICSVTDGIGTAKGGFWKGFRTHNEMYLWLAKKGYNSHPSANVSR